MFKEGIKNKECQIAYCIIVWVGISQGSHIMSYEGHDLADYK